MNSKFDWDLKDLTILSTILASIVGSIVSTIMKLVPVNISILMFLIILSAIETALFISWTRSKKLLISVLPEEEVPIPVGGEELNITIFNRNNFDLDCKIELEFTTNILRIHNGEGNEVEEKYEKRITVRSMNKFGITFELLPEQYHAKGCIFYLIKPELKIVNKIKKGKIRVST